MSGWFTVDDLKRIITDPRGSAKAYAAMIVAWVVQYFAEYGVEVPGQVQTDARSVVGFVLLSAGAFFATWLPRNR